MSDGVSFSMFANRRSFNLRPVLNRMVSAYVERLEHHVRENIPCWEHRFEEETFRRMATLPHATVAQCDDVYPQAIRDS